MYNFVEGVDCIVFLKFLLCLVSPKFSVFVLCSVFFAGRIMSGVVLHCIVLEEFLTPVLEEEYP